VASVQVTNVRFDTVADVTLGAAAAWVALTPYVVGNYVKNGGNVYICITAGTSAGSGGPTTTAADITDGTVHWEFLGVGDGYANVVATSELNGPIVALTGTATQIETPVLGWNAVINLADAIPGLNADTDAQLRARRLNELPGNSRSTLDAIRTRVLEDVPGVTACFVFQNTTDITNGDGMPPHSVEVLVAGGDAQVIVDVIFANVAAGIATAGSSSGTHTDAANAGQTYTVKYSRPTPEDVYVVVNVTKDPSVFPADGVTQIQNALLAYGSNILIPGKDVVAAALSAQVFSVAGVLDVTVYIGLAPSPVTSTTITITPREVALLDSSRITITPSDGTP
jgi:uncharacterized phage protein gp47/JayE